MKSLLLFFALASLMFDVRAQSKTFVRDSIMEVYMVSGEANKLFRPKGKYNGQTRVGFWKDYEVMNTFAYIYSNGETFQDFGQFMVYGTGYFKDGKRTGDWSLFLVEDKTYKKIKLMDLSYENGLSSGDFVHYFVTGEIGMTGRFKDGRLDGVIKSFYPNGKVYGVRNLVNGSREGVQTYYYQSGEVKFFHTFKGDSLNGEYKGFYEDGTIKENFFGVNGQIDGAYYYYYPDGSVWVERLYDDGNLMEIRALYSKSGQPLDSGTLKNGNGIVKYYTEEGKVYSIITFEGGKQIKEEKVN